MSIESTPAAATAAADFLPLLLALAILIASAKLVGSLSVRLGQPAVLGELIAGLLLGPTFLNLTSLPLLEGPDLGRVLHQLGQLGVLWLMFAAGLEAELDDLRRSGKPALLAFGGRVSRRCWQGSWALSPPCCSASVSAWFFAILSRMLYSSV